MVEKIECNNDIGATWDNTNWGVLFTGNIQSTKCNVYFQEAVATEFSYTGSEQIFTADTTGIYKLETWGAQGDSSSGGYGAYSVGTVNLNKGDKLYIYVGSSVTSNSNIISGNVFWETSGGYNGGGNGYYSGGGATHIATTSGLLSTLSSKKDKILIVSGGGGGSGFYGGASGDSGACYGGGGGGSSYIGNLC